METRNNLLLIQKRLLFLRDLIRDENVHLEELLKAWKNRYHSTFEENKNIYFYVTRELLKLENTKYAKEYAIYIAIKTFDHIDLQLIASILCSCGFYSSKNVLYHVNQFKTPYGSKKTIPLFHAIIQNKASAVLVFVNNQFSYETMNQIKMINLNPLLYAIRINANRIAQILAHKIVELNLINHIDECLKTAISKNNVDIVKAIIQNKKIIFNTDEIEFYLNLAINNDKSREIIKFLNNKRISQSIEKSESNSNGVSILSSPKIQKNDESSLFDIQSLLNKTNVRDNLSQNTNDPNHVQPTKDIFFGNKDQENEENRFIGFMKPMSQDKDTPSPRVLSKDNNGKNEMFIENLRHYIK